MPVEIAGKAYSKGTYKSSGVHVWIGRYRFLLAHNVLQPVLYGKFQANAVAPCQLQWRLPALRVIDRPNRVDDMISTSAVM